MSDAPFSPLYFWIAYAASNALALAAVWGSRRFPRPTRLFLSLLFGWASWFTVTTALESPWVYLDYADSAIGPYRAFILGPFEALITPVVSTIAAGQGLIALAMLGRGYLFRLGCWGGMLFGLAIAPLGLYAAFPSTVLLALAFYFLQRNPSATYLWKRP